MLFHRQFLVLDNGARDSLMDSSKADGVQFSLDERRVHVPRLRVPEWDELGKRKGISTRRSCRRMWSVELRHWTRRVKATVVQAGLAPNTTDYVSRWESILPAARYNAQFRSRV